MFAPSTTLILTSAILTLRGETTSYIVTIMYGKLSSKKVLPTVSYLIRNARLASMLWQDYTVLPLLLLLKANIMNNDEIINWVAKQVGYNISDDEALEMYEIYRQYRDEGQSHEVSKQYAGM